MFACILITEYLPLSTLQYSLLKSYRNNRERKCGPVEDQDFLDQGNNEYNCDLVEARLSQNTGRPRLGSGEISKRSGDTNPIYVQEIVYQDDGDRYALLKNKMDKSSIYASKISTTRNNGKLGSQAGTPKL
jgi:hypothetical protein